MSMLSQGPLTDEEIKELDQFLLDGFLTAIVCGPKTIMPSEWMRCVWDMERGEDAPESKDQAQAQRILGFLVRHMNGIVLHAVGRSSRQRHGSSRRSGRRKLVG